MIDKSAYLLRISRASPAGLVVINFEIILEYLNLARAAFNSEGMSSDAKRSLEAGNSNESFTANIQKAKDGIEQLIQSLDFEIPLAQDFYEIYTYSYKLLSDVHFSKDTQAACAAVKEVAEHMEQLLIGWRDAEEKIGEAPENGEAPKVYTGLTYGKDGQANEYIEDDNKGFMA